MGRPLNKKYFGNRNAGTSVSGDDGIGGNRVASVTLGTLGAYTTRPTVTFSDPDLLGAGGVRATGTVTSEILSVVVSGTMADYADGDEIYFGDAVITVGADGAGAIDGVTYTARGTFTTLASGAQATTTDGAGTGAEITVTYRAKAVVITEAGSGYTDATDAAATFTQSVTGTTVLESYTVGGAIGNNENAIVAFAYHTGGSLLRGDIVKQVSKDRYKVENATTTAIAKLKSTIANAAGEMNIVATDASGGTYYVTKLTGRRATLVPAAVARLSTSAGSTFASGESAPWKFDAAATGYVQIENT